MQNRTGLDFKVVAVDLNASRREKMKAVLESISTSVDVQAITVTDIREGKDIVAQWTRGIGCNAVLEVNGSTI